MGHVLSVVLSVMVGLYLMLGFLLMVMTALDYFQGKIKLRDETIFGISYFFARVCFIGPLISIVGIVLSKNSEAVKEEVIEEFEEVKNTDT